MLRLNLTQNRRSLLSRVRDLIRERGGMFATNCVGTFLRWDVVRCLNELHDAGEVRFYAVFVCRARRIRWDTPLVVPTDVQPDPEWARVTRPVEGVRGTIGLVRIAWGGRDRRTTRERHGRRR